MTEKTQNLDETVARFLQDASAEAFPQGARFGSAEAASYLRRQRERATRDPVVQPMAAVEELSTESGVPVRVYRPDTGPGSRPLVVYFHGGGWVMGDLDRQDSTCRTIAGRAQAVVVNVGYRLAPEYPYPAALNDCCEATAWAILHAAEWGADPNKAIVGGPSAGGNLAAAVAISRRDHGIEPPLVGQLLLWPVLDARMSSESYAEKADGFLLTAAEMRFFWDAYVQNNEDRTDPRLSPALVCEVAGLPPALVVTAEHDPLRDEGNAFARRLEGESLLVRHIEMPGQIHGFLTLFPSSFAAKATLDAIVDAVGALSADPSRRATGTIVCASTQ